MQKSDQKDPTAVLVVKT